MRYIIPALLACLSAGSLFAQQAGFNAYTFGGNRSEASYRAGFTLADGDVLVTGALTNPADDSRVDAIAQRWSAAGQLVWQERLGKAGTLSAGVLIHVEGNALTVAVHQKTDADVEAKGTYLFWSLTTDGKAVGSVEAEGGKKGLSPYTSELLVSADAYYLILAKSKLDEDAELVRYNRRGEKTAGEKLESAHSSAVFLRGESDQILVRTPRQLLSFTTDLSETTKLRKYEADITTATNDVGQRPTIVRVGERAVTFGTIKSAGRGKDDYADVLTVIDSGTAVNVDLPKSIVAHARPLQLRARGRDSVAVLIADEKARPQWAILSTSGFVNKLVHFPGSTPNQLWAPWLLTDGQTKKLHFVERGTNTTGRSAKSYVRATSGATLAVTSEVEAESALSIGACTIDPRGRTVCVAPAETGMQLLTLLSNGERGEPAVSIVGDSRGLVAVQPEEIYSLPANGSGGFHLAVVYRRGAAKYIRTFDDRLNFVREDRYDANTQASPAADGSYLVAMSRRGFVNLEYIYTDGRIDRVGTVFAGELHAAGEDALITAAAVEPEGEVALLMRSPEALDATQLVLFDRNGNVSYSKGHGPVIDKLIFTEDRDLVLGGHREFLTLAADRGYANAVSASIDLPDDLQLLDFGVSTGGEIYTVMAPTEQSSTQANYVELGGFVPGRAGYQTLYRSPAGYKVSSASALTISKDGDLILSLLSNRGSSLLVRNDGKISSATGLPLGETELRVVNPVRDRVLRFRGDGLPYGDPVSLHDLRGRLIVEARLRSVEEATYQLELPPNTVAGTYVLRTGQQSALVVVAD